MNNYQFKVNIKQANLLSVVKLRVDISNSIQNLSFKPILKGTLKKRKKIQFMAMLMLEHQQ